MDLAINLGRRGLGQSWPNPSVGCVIVNNGKIVGQGNTGLDGVPHAETIALGQAGESAKGGDLYVTLEPCCHEGKTPPCVKAIVESGIKKIFCPLVDPDPRVSGKGFAFLRQANIEIDLIPEAKKKAEDLARGFILKIKDNRPYITLKMATSIDGRIATKTGHSKWISSELSRERVQLLRSQSDAIMVGKNTFNIDRPGLNLRGALRERKQPLRVFLDRNLDISPSANKQKDLDLQSTIIFHGPTYNTKNKKLWERLGAETIQIPLDNSKINLRNAVSILSGKGVLNLLVEGGGEVASYLLKNNLLDKIIIYSSGLILGANGTPIFAKIFDEATTIEQFPRFHLKKVTKLQNNIESVWDCNP